MLHTLQFYRLRLQCSSECLSARFGFGRCAVRAQAWSICSSWLPCADNCGVALAVSAAPFGTSTARVQGAPGLLGFGLSALALVLRSSRVPSRLTIRSSRPRIVASATCYALRLHVSAAPLRGGLTQALGAEKHSAFLLWSLQFTAFVCSALRHVSRRVVLRLQFCARSGLACVTGQWRVQLCRLLTSGCTFSVRGALGVFRFGFRQRRRGGVVLGFPSA